MAVRVRLRVKGGGRSLTTSALVNSGFEADEPQLLVPLGLAERLGLTAADMDIEDFSVAGGARASGYRLRGTFHVELALEDRESAAVRAVLTVLPGESETIISDHLASSLGIVLLDPRRGEWCLRDELGSKRRVSEQPAEW